MRGAVLSTWGLEFDDPVANVKPTGRAEYGALKGGQSMSGGGN